MQKWQVISNQSDGANFMPRIEKLMYKQQVLACVGMTSKPNVILCTLAFVHEGGQNSHDSSLTGG
jgi:hypothetical protein